MGKNKKNLSKYDRSVLALKKKDIISANAKKNQGARIDISGRSVKSIDTQKQLAKDAGVSHDTIYKVEVIERSVSEEQKDKIRNHTSSIHKVYEEIVNQKNCEKENQDLYFIGCENINMVKIGIAYFVANRLKDIQNMCPIPIGIIGIIENGGKGLERELHKKFNHLRSHGEWFILDGELIDYIRRNCSNTKWLLAR